MRKVVQNTEQRLGVNAEDDFKEFLAHFYTEAVAGLLIDEFRGEKGHGPQKAADYFAIILEKSLLSIMKNV